MADPASLDDRTGWKEVPNDLLSLEREPAKASSDPGYYGRAYAFKGDAVVENHAMTALFCSARGRLVIFSKRMATNAQPDIGGAGTRLLELLPFQAKSGSATIKEVEIVRNAADEVVLQVSFKAASGPEVAGLFAFDKTGIVEVKPGAGLKGMSLVGAINYGILPDFVSDDLIYSAADYPSKGGIYVPAENVLLGLMEGGNQEFVMTWPKGKQQVVLELGKEQEGKRHVEAVDFENDGQSFYVGVLSAPAVWHRETLAADFLEKDVPIKWKRPFPAKWKTELYEGEVKARYAFRENKGDIWRGVPGSYNYPVWFEGDQAYFHLGKKVPPKGEAVIYFVEGQETPLWVLTPVDMLRSTLGRAMSEDIIDVAGRMLSTHHRRGADGVRRACTCGCTEAIQAVFETGEEVAKKEYIDGAVDDMIYFVHRHVERIDRYKKFAEEMLQFLQSKATASPQLKPFIETLEPIARQIPEEYNVQKENMKNFAYADDLRRQTLALADKKDPNNLKAYNELLKAWRAMGGAQDYVLAQCHTITRHLSQQAGYGCVDTPEAMALATEIRARCRECLRNPDGYEIWADY